MAKDAYTARVTTIWLGQIFELTIKADSAAELDKRCRELKRIIDSTKRATERTIVPPHARDGLQGVV